MKPTKPWIKGGIIAAIVYTILNFVLFFWGMACGYNSNPQDVICPIVEWMYWHFFIIEHIEFLFVRYTNLDTWMFMMLLIDIAVAFIAGALLTEGFRRLRKKA